MENHTSNICDVLFSLFNPDNYPSSEEGAVIIDAVKMITFKKKKRWILFSRKISPDQFEDEVCKLFEERGMERLLRDFKWGMISRSSLEV
jgi:hypothetical protein